LLTALREEVQERRVEADAPHQDAQV
jgi:hypothetical protein